MEIIENTFSVEYLRKQSCTDLVLNWHILFK